jgi:hypothetical protein
LSYARQLNRQHLRFARARAYIPGMSDLDYWTAALKKAEQELDAATTRSAVNAAAQRLMRVKAELKAVGSKRRADSCRPRSGEGGQPDGITSS